MEQEAVTQELRSSPVGRASRPSELVKRRGLLRLAVEGAEWRVAPADDNALLQDTAEWVAALPEPRRSLAELLAQGWSFLAIGRDLVELERDFARRFMPGRNPMPRLKLWHHNSRRTHCHRDHELAGKNLMLRHNGKRACAECARGSLPNRGRFGGLSTAENNAQKTHCKHNHQLSGDNLAIRSNGARRCKACQRAQNRAATERRRRLA